MKRKKKKQEEPSIFAVVIVVAILTLFIKGCDAYCDKHHDEWQEEHRKKIERNMQEAFYNCKFEHDY